GLPSGHISYVKNVKPGMPLFLFNYSDRKMHGIFEAACAGQLNIDQFAWSDGGRIKTQFPAQVLISLKTQCYPVPESQFKSVISDNYHKPRHFYFELDHAQTRALISLFKPAPVHDVTNKWDLSKSLQSPTTKAYPGPTKSESYTKDLDPFGVSSESHYVAPYKLANPEGEYASGSRTSTNHFDEESSNWDDLDDAATKEGTESVNNDHQYINTPHEEQHDTVAVRQKLQELFVLGQQEAQSSKDTVDSASDPPDSTLKADAPSEDLTSLGKCHGNAELLHIINELSKRTQAMERKLVESNKEKLFLRESVKDTERRVQQLECQFEKLQLNYNSLAPLLSRPHDNVEGPSIFLLGGYRGSTCLSSLDIFCPRTDRLVPLCPMSSARAYAAVAALKDHIYIFGGGDGSSWYHSGKHSNMIECQVFYISSKLLTICMSFIEVECYSRGGNRWMTCPRLKHGKGSLAGTTLNDKIFAIGGGDGSAVFSEVEMFDPALGRWIDSLSMRQNDKDTLDSSTILSFCATSIDSKFTLNFDFGTNVRAFVWLFQRFAPAAAVFNSALYVTGGYDGNMYLQSAERYDPREGFWTLLPSMSVRRGSHSVAVLGEALYAVGGYDGRNRVSTVEIFDPRANSWRIGSPFSIKRGYGCAVTMDDNLFYIGGVNDAGETVDTVEVYNERQGWSITGCQSVGGRGFACGIAV
ncbi:Kelch-like protein 17, partial [Dichanthelium oligosanthes]